jgi:hypothetical protein
MGQPEHENRTKGGHDVNAPPRAFCLRRLLRYPPELRQRPVTLILLGEQGTLEEVEPFLHGIELLL